MKTICSVNGCDRTAAARKLCQAHWARWRRGVPIGGPLTTKLADRRCTIDGCGRKHAAHGLCMAHYNRRNSGMPLDVPLREVFQTDDLHERLRHYCPEGAPDECWEWTRARNKNYGMIAIGDGKLRGAHIVAWELANDRKLPEGMVIRHSCDNPPCTNPRHLLLGTHGDNVNDKVSRGRQDAGIKQALSRLTNEQVVAICELYQDGWSQSQLATRFDVSQQLISTVVRGKGWKHLGASVIPATAPPRHHKLSKDQADEIRSLYASGAWTHSRLAKKFAVSPATVSLVVNGKIWA
jgi:transposase